MLRKKLSINVKATGVIYGTEFDYHKKNYVRETDTLGKSGRWAPGRDKQHTDGQIAK